MNITHKLILTENSPKCLRELAVCILKSFVGIGLTKAHAIAKELHDNGKHSFDWIVPGDVIELYQRGCIECDIHYPDNYMSLYNNADLVTISNLSNRGNDVAKNIINSMINRGLIRVTN